MKSDQGALKNDFGFYKEIEIESNVCEKIKQILLLMFFLFVLVSFLIHY